MTAPNTVRITMIIVRKMPMITLMAAIAPSLIKRQCTITKTTAKPIGPAIIVSKSGQWFLIQSNTSMTMRLTAPNIVSVTAFIWDQLRTIRPVIRITARASAVHGLAAATFIAIPIAIIAIVAIRIGPGSDLNAWIMADIPAVKYPKTVLTAGPAVVANRMIAGSAVPERNWVNATSGGSSAEPILIARTSSPD